jgi:hypothetical protein
VDVLDLFGRCYIPTRSATVAKKVLLIALPKNNAYALLHVLFVCVNPFHLRNTMAIILLHRSIHLICIPGFKIYIYYFITLPVCAIPGEFFEHIDANLSLYWRLRNETKYASFSLIVIRMISHGISITAVQNRMYTNIPTFNRPFLTYDARQVI